MTVLLAGVVLFAALHIVPALPDLKGRIAGRLGALYGPLFGLTSVLALALIVFGWRMADFVAVYAPPVWGWYANLTLTFLAFQCLAVFLCRGTLRQRLRFPMGIAVLLWGSGHLLANGDLRSLILFGGLMAYAVLHIALGIGRGAGPTPDIRSGHDLLAFMVGITLYAAMTQLHAALIGVPIFAL